MIAKKNKGSGKKTGQQKRQSHSFNGNLLFYHFFKSRTACKMKYIGKSSKKKFVPYKT